MGMLGAATLLESCTTQYIYGTLTYSYLEIPLDAFEVKKKGETRYRNSLIVQHDDLKYPISVFRQSSSEYHALWMKCTHMGTELQVFGDHLECPAHGSEFTNTGAVQNGPAATALRSFQVVIDKRILKIDLT
jgi:nitrite reductase/ring-hydroxylating ferredoxin subunit